jgi:hypothetical protein
MSRGKMGFPKEKIIARVKEVRIDICGGRRGAQKIFAEQVLKIKYTTYREYESKIVDLDFLQALSDRFGYRIEWLLLGQKPRKKE